MLQLYYARNSCALATHIALEEVGADYSTVRVDFDKAEQRSPDYLKINPKGRVPSLVTDRGILTETPALLVFVAQLFPGANLALIDEPFAFARVQSFNAFICSTLHPAHAHMRRGSRWVDPDDTHSLEAMKRKVPQTVGDAFGLIEREMLQGPWVMGERYTICDPYLFTMARLTIERDGVDPKKLPRVIEHRARVGERAAVKRALAQQGEE